MLQSDKLKEYMVTIGVEQQLSDSDLHEHKYLKNIKKWYKYSGKCDYQFKYKAILEAYFLSTPEVFTQNLIMV